MIRSHALNLCPGVQHGTQPLLVQPRPRQVSSDRFASSWEPREVCTRAKEAKNYRGKDSRGSTMHRESSARRDAVCDNLSLGVMSYKSSSSPKPGQADASSGSCPACPKHLNPWIANPQTLKSRTQKPWKRVCANGPAWPLSCVRVHVAALS